MGGRGASGTAKIPSMGKSNKAKTKDIIDIEKLDPYKTGLIREARKYNNPEARGTNDVKINKIEEDGIKRKFIGSYETLVSNNKEKSRVRERGEIIEFAHRLYGVHKGDLEYRITDLKTGMIIGSTKSEHHVQDKIFLFDAAISRNKDAVKGAERLFNETTKKKKKK